ncbi:hypothetical protein RQP54_06175 [Curvibacter sp. APW13]|uniref:hypothetical protein n=1 Tax=Curvibacter sp. APW13 TaxID=3077236 RepID=UPI0028DE0794|nr:hypothetical protein [Curvibacter sp. APW13]MDT8990450.1 hypothetical protein [Curvibacter sp. APW13]
MATLRRMKLQRLFQPRNPLFWIFLVLNGLSTVLSWLTHTYALSGWLAVVVLVFAVGNAVLGMRIAWRLVHS